MEMHELNNSSSTNFIVKKENLFTFAILSDGFEKKRLGTANFLRLLDYFFTFEF